MEVTRFDPDTEGASEVAAFTGLYLRARAVDEPGAPDVTADAVASMVRNAGLGSWPTTYWLARDAGKVVAFGAILRFVEENPHLVQVWVTVDPALRGRGYGTALLRVLLAEVRRLGRTRAIAPRVLAGSRSESWVRRLGFAAANGYLHQRLDLTAPPADRWAGIGIAAGYRIGHWRDTAPEELLPTLARARNAMQDMPHGTISADLPFWTPERVRREEAAIRERGQQQWMTVAVHEDSGEVAGITELVLKGAALDRAEQRDTAVLAAHRGRGLGRSIKAETLRRLLAERPMVAAVHTQTSVTNAPMQRVNHGLGFVDLRTSLEFEADVAEVVAALSVLPGHRGRP